jgi:hypothetical protein
LVQAQQVGAQSVPALTQVSPTWPPPVSVEDGNEQPLLVCSDELEVEPPQATVKLRSNP